MATYDPDQHVPSGRRGQRQADPVSRALERPAAELRKEIDASIATGETLLHQHQAEAAPESAAGDVA